MQGGRGLAAAEPPWIRQQRKAFSHSFFMTFFLGGGIINQGPYTFASMVQTFTAWCNHFLKQRELSLVTLERDLADGVLLCHLLELLSGKRIRNSSFHAKPRFKLHCLENLTQCFAFMVSQHITLVNIGPEGLLFLL